MMKKRSLTVVILVIVVLILTVIVVDVLNNRPDRRGENPYALEVDQYRQVDPELISHSETRNLSLGERKATAIFIREYLYVLEDSALSVITKAGKPVRRFGILPGAVALWVEGRKAFVAHGSFISVYDLDEALLLERWEDLGQRAVITGMAGAADRLYVADAGNRRVLMYKTDGERIGEFEGKAETEVGHGFIIPSANFDLLINDFGELWVVNPGKHAIENYSDDGRMRGYWEHTSFEIEGFLGCCNPARIWPMSDGRIATSEKGMVRIKIYGASGELKSVVAGPDLFAGEGKAPDIVADGETIYALDYERNSIRVFERKE